MKDILLGQYMPLESPIHRLDARVKLLGLFMVFAGLLISRNFWGYLNLIGFTLLVIFLARLALRQVLAQSLRLYPFFLLILLINSLFLAEGEILYSLGRIKIYQEGVFQGLRVIINLLLMMTLSTILMTSTSPRDITQALTSLLKPLKFIGLPVEEVAMILSIALQFIPGLLEEAALIKKAQRARGARFDSRKLSHRLDSFSAMVVPVFIGAFKRADDLSLAMEARGYRGAKNRSPRARKKLVSRDYLALLLCGILVFIQVYLRGF